MSIVSINRQAADLCSSLLRNLFVNRTMSAARVTKSATSILRQLGHELRKQVPDKRVANEDVFKYVMSQYRKFDVTDERTCKAKNEMLYVAETYLTYLNSSRKQQELHQKYYSKGERSAEETATLLGFKIPNKDV